MPLKFSRSFAQYFIYILALWVHAHTQGRGCSLSVNSRDLSMIGQHTTGTMLAVNDYNFPFVIQKCNKVKYTGIIPDILIL